MSFLSPKVPPLPDVPKRSDAEIQAEALGERKRRGKARGRASTILSDESATVGPSAKKVLTGE